MFWDDVCAFLKNTKSGDEEVEFCYLEGQVSSTGKESSPRPDVIMILMMLNKYDRS